MDCSTPVLAHYQYLAHYIHPTERTLKEVQGPLSLYKGGVGSRTPSLLRKIMVDILKLVRPPTEHSDSNSKMLGRTCGPLV